MQFHCLVICIYLVFSRPNGMEIFSLNFALAIILQISTYPRMIIESMVHKLLFIMRFAITFWTTEVPYARHYNPRFVYFLPTF